ncbi:haloacid dehalogenase type II [Frankia sp. CNm7]|uniref:Haloacid dehalogenase type II n=1 Tax=Frankia nepalensis TaxID=1836974 RepID=A0A937USC4_9ACTN|nr:haloacid dehalogenase type II [Frankia nepalensis]MBL7495097.1 haloacid dehalogenase type II [Frankia nepalensis]MBL7515374.1 haloacid dehalogenase type II [Frankia nepalensis]MBL7522242.1 haloacid dehalogenase type II [Frankia nepalensis]MBL7632327.1 haloacid dehalogenase type II [Frankia nepalensis]
MDSPWVGAEPSVLVFDVNETLIDVESLEPLFEAVFGDRRVMRQWLDQLFLYSITATLSGQYEGFFALGQGVLRMVGDIHGVRITDTEAENLRTGMLTMPAHPDVAAGLGRLSDAGFRMVTLTNSPANPAGPSPLEHAGLARFFERRFTVETVRAYKPASATYHLVSRALGVPPGACMMVAAHVWDTIGAQSAGYTAGLITRPGNAPLPVASLPQPNLVARDLPDLADQLIRRWRR